MIGVLEILLVTGASLGFVLAFFVAVEVACAFLPPRRRRDAEPGSIAVVVPAHDEAASIGATLAGLKTELRPGDRLIVVADNCADATADIAASAGAETLVRTDFERRGKGFALQFAIDSLRTAPPSIIVVVDADCRVAPGSIVALARQSAASGRPAQMLNRMRAPEGAPPARRVAAFAWLVMNEIRMPGLDTLIDATRLTGTGMALPWAIASEVELASGEIVEDLALSLRLAGQGASATLCRQALVQSVFPMTEETAARQHARWEHGSLRLAARLAPSAMFEAVRTRNLRLGALALDVAVPPIVLFVAILATLFLLSLPLLVFGRVAAFVISGGALLILIAAIAAAWARFGRSVLPAREFGALAAYAFGKARVYGASARRSSRQWTRTDREEPK